MGMLRMTGISQLIIADAEIPVETPTDTSVTEPVNPTLPESTPPEVDPTVIQEPAQGMQAGE